MQSKKPEIHYLNAIVVLAEELNYTQAAKRLGMTQSRLSRCIQALEHKLGLRLFKRERGPVELTDSGRAYVEQARISILHGERAVHFAKAANAGADAVLMIGSSPDIDPILVDLLFSIRLPLYPTLKINLQSEFSPELVHRQPCEAGAVSSHLYRHRSSCHVFRVATRTRRSPEWHARQVTKFFGDFGARSTLIRRYGPERPGGGCGEERRKWGQAARERFLAFYIGKETVLPQDERVSRGRNLKCVLLELDTGFR